MKMNNFFHKVGENKGSTLTEYAVILGLIALVAWGAVSSLGVDAANVFSFLGSGAASGGAAANPKGLKAIDKLGT